MGARGPKSKASATMSTTVRLSLGVRDLVETSAAKRRVTVSQEIENRLTRSLIHDTMIAEDFGNRQIYAVARLVFAAARSTVGRRKLKFLGQPESTGGRRNWLVDAGAFDAAVASINKVFELIRPVGEHGAAGATYQAEFNAVETVLEIQKAPAVLPAKASRHMQSRVSLRKDIGDIIDGAVIRGITAEQARKQAELLREYAALRRKEIRSNDDDNRMKALRGEIERLPRPRP
jgi:hypothetical protein